MNELQIFSSPEFGELRTIEEGDKIYFVASDVAKALGYKRPADAVTTHCKGSVKRRLPTNGGTEKNMPTQRAMDMKLFEVKEGSFVDGNGVNRITRTTKVTGKGQVYFVNKFLNGSKAVLE